MNHLLDDKGAAVILSEETEWEKAVIKFIGADALLLSVSTRIGDSRVYLAGDRVAKIRSRRAFLPPGVIRLTEEKGVLDRLGTETLYAEDGKWECLSMPRIDGVPLNQVVGTMSLERRVRLLVGLHTVLNKLHTRKVAHTDLRSDNLIILTDGSMALIDFDRARVEPPLAAAMADWVGLSRIGFSENPFWKFALYLLVPKMSSLANRIRATSWGTRRMMPHKPSDPVLMRLEDAWRLAEHSGANAPGQHIAYYAFTFKGWHFLGERPWYQRWEPIRRAVSFRNRRVLDLGANMGLLSTFAAIHGASDVVGVDRNGQIIAAARMIASALGARVRFEQIDLAGDDDWESKLAGADMVVALSLLQWLPRQERVMRFIASHAEVLYEGHGSIQYETDRLRSAGFDRVSVLAVTERGRGLLHGEKSSSV